MCHKKSGSHLPEAMMPLYINLCDTAKMYLPTMTTYVRRTSLFKYIYNGNKFDKTLSPDYIG